jgi:hypothetical protein
MLLIFCLRIYSNMFRLLEAIFRLNIKEYIYIYLLQCLKMDDISFTLTY